MDDHVLFGKYRLIRKLGSGASGTVYLAYHIGLQELRAIKMVPKTIRGYDSFLSEALLLKDLHHPGIPIVYDVEEDQFYSYLIEEYLEGESLHKLVQHLGSLSKETTLEFSIQICFIIHFMYSMKNPILFLDLQPDNLLICDGRIRLIDFDHACYRDAVKEQGKRYGTAGFAAPEQYHGGSLDLRTDLYSVGALMYYMLRGRPPEQEPDLSDPFFWDPVGKVIKRLLRTDPGERYQTASDLAEVLEELKSDILKEQAIHSQIITVAGAAPGTGTTHAALALADYLSAAGYPVLYLEAVESHVVRQLAGWKRLKPDRYGNYHIGRIHLRPFYGEAVSLKDQYFPIILKDIGTGWKNDPGLIKDADRLILVGDGKWWGISRLCEAAGILSTKAGLMILYGCGSEICRECIPEGLAGFPSAVLPYFPDPFCKNKDVFRIFQELFLQTEGGDQWKGKRRRSLWKKKR